MRRRAFTLLELLGVVLAIAILLVLFVPVLGRSGPSGGHSRQVRDSYQLRGIHQALVVWRQGNNDEYPLPSRLDRLNFTVSEQGRAKDTTANLYLIMLFSGSLSPDMLVSPLENNRHVRACDAYQMELPSGAVDPQKALWDPKFSVALDGSNPGNASYAHLQPSGTRLDRYHNSFVGTDMILANRGPEITDARKNSDGSVSPTLANPASNTLRFFGRDNAWSGNAVYNDNHVEFLRDWLVPGKPYSKSRGRTYDAADGKQWPDLWCYDEPDDPKAVNDYLGIFIKAGETPAEFKAVWD